jgi:hypothetical protein
MAPADADRHDPILIIVLELVQGTPLEQWHRGKPFRMRLEVLADLAETVAGLNANGQAHGDLFVGNVLVRTDGIVVLIDPDAEQFGSSRMSPSVASRERRQDVVGVRGIIEHCTTDQAGVSRRRPKKIATGHAEAARPAPTPW